MSFWWDGRDDDMRRVVSNLYIVTVEAKGALERKSRYRTEQLVG